MFMYRRYRPQEDSSKELSQVIFGPGQMMATPPGPVGAAATIARLLAAPTTQVETSNARPLTKPAVLLRESAGLVEAVGASFEPVLALSDACGIAPEVLYADLAQASVLQLRGKSDEAFRPSCALAGTSQWRLTMQLASRYSASNKSSPSCRTSSWGLVLIERPGLSHCL